jgi:cytochrome c oxidase subunit 2
MALLSIGVASAQTGMPGGATDEAHDIHDLYVFVLTLALVVFVIVEAVLIFCIVRFRKKDDALPRQVHGSNALELAWTGIPVLIVASIFVFSFITLDRIENDAEPEDLTVEVTGFQWQWQFVYHLNDLGPGSNPDDEGVITILGTPDEEPTLVLPVDEVIELKLIGADVIHSFYVRDFLYKLDLIPGRDNRFTVTARDTGVFEAQCAEYCGTDHAFMRFHVEIMTRADFDAWVQEQTSAADTARVP